MSTLVKARYKAQERILRLAEPLEGFEDDAEVEVTVTPAPRYTAAELEQRPWLKFSGSMSKENGEDFARVLEEMFPIEK